MDVWSALSIDEDGDQGHVVKQEMKPEAHCSPVLERAQGTILNCFCFEQFLPWVLISHLMPLFLL